MGVGSPALSDVLIGLTDLVLPHGADCCQRSEAYF